MKLSALILNGSLKPAKETSNTAEMAKLLTEKLKTHDVSVSMPRLSGWNIKVGIGHNEGKGDEWPALEKEIKKADILVLATPIWWSHHSSLIQRVIERMDNIDEEFLSSGKNPLYNKVAGIIVTGAEDGASRIYSDLLGPLTWFGYTIPPECGLYWTGEVGRSPENPVKVFKTNPTVKKMAEVMARNLAYWGRLLKENPLPDKKSIKEKI